MYCVQNRIFYGVCSESYVTDNYPSPLKSQGHKFFFRKINVASQS